MKIVLAGLAVVFLAALALLLWPTHGDARPEAEVAPLRVPQRMLPSLPPPSLPAEPAAAPVAEVAKALTANKLDPASEAFRNQMDERIPGRLYTEAVRCYKGGLDRNQKLKVEYRLVIADGQVSVASVRVLESTLTDKVLERCMLDEIKRARWQEDQMPDWEATEELLMRVRGFKSHMQDKEADVD